MTNSLIVELEPPEKRRKGCDGENERHLTEAAVMLAYGLHLLETAPNLKTVEIHPDGEHGKRFGIASWLSKGGFTLTEARGKTDYCGRYVNGEKQIVVTCESGKGDVFANTENGTITAECKGGIVNTRHSGQVSRLRKGLCEAVGLLLTRPRTGRQFAVVPWTEATFRLAQKMAPRAKEAGIEISLVKEDGRVIDVKP